MKKKGLIISTVVMVVVLIASLTTATYAWFNSQAQATVDDLSIKTQAQTGLQIAMTKDLGSTTTIYSGDLTYTNGWGGNEGWGTYLGFSSIEVGNISHAGKFITSGTVPIFDGYVKATGTFNATKDYYTATEATVADDASVVGLFVADANNANKLVAATGTKQAGPTYYNVTRVEKNKATSAQFANYYTVSTADTEINDTNKGFYQPTSYDSKVEPEGYVKVEPNQTGTYYYLTMAVSNTIEIGALGFSLEVVPKGSTNLATKDLSVSNPGMAAATRIKIDVAQGTNGSAQSNAFTSKTIAPFNAYKLNVNTKTMAKGTADSNDLADETNENGCYTVLLGKNLAVNSVYFVTFTIWVEGPDKECNDLTTGSEMQFNINFAYSAKGTETISSYTFTNITDVANATSLTFAS